MPSLDYPADGPLTGPDRDAWHNTRLSLALFDHLLEGLVLREQLAPVGLVSRWKVSRRPRLEHFMRSFGFLPVRFIKYCAGSREIELTEIRNVSFLSGLRLFVHGSGQLYLKYQFNFASVDRYGTRPFPISRDELVARDMLARAITAIADPAAAYRTMRMPII